jgi:acyl-CoA synthetase (AMP-forming)/AMP-acid ligase II
MMSWVLLTVAMQQVNGFPNKGSAPEDAAALLTVPLFHVTGCHSLFLLSVLIGRKLVMMYKWNPEQALALIEEEKITYVNGVPTVSQELLDAAEKSERDISSLVDLYSGGAARPAEHVRRINDDFQLNPGSGYGLTETNAMGSVNAGFTYMQKPGSVGIPSPAVTQIRIVDEKGAELASGERGEICIRSAANARCYWNQPEATAAAFRDGWFHTGDVGYLDEDNMLFIVDRIKDIIIRGGENISCLEVEAAIYACKQVAEVAVFGLPDTRLGEVVGATVYLKPGAVLSEDELREFLSDHIAAFKIPVYMEFSKQPLPRMASDKIFKRQIKEQVMASFNH